jgi:phosphoglycolate phosphatase-like HAD superfamily hydrolase
MNRHLLLLFDIDGTLVRMRRGLPREIFEAMFRDECSLEVSLEGFDYSGKTDRQIVQELGARVGMAPEAVEEFQAKAMTYIETSLARMMSLESLELLPGVLELLDDLNTRNDCTLAILTGNTPGGAKAKLDVFGLSKYFEFGVYGSQAHDRNQLGPLALAMASDLPGMDALAPNDVVVIGDSIRDAACANAIGARSIITLTGRELEHTFIQEPVQRFFKDLSKTAEVVDAIYQIQG